MPWFPQLASDLMETAIGLRSTVKQIRTVTMLPAIEITDSAALVRSARQGDRSAFGQLYRLFSPMVHGILLAKSLVEHFSDRGKTLAQLQASLDTLPR